MDSNTTSDDGRIELNDRGAGMTATRTVGGAYSMIEIPDHVDDDADLEITGHALDDEPTPVPERDAGYETFTATVTAVIDPKPWLEGEGTLVDETGAVIDYIVRDGSGTAPTLEEGEEYHFRRARLTADEAGAPVIEIRPGATEVKQASRPSGLGEHEQSADDADATATDDSAEVSATDGGEPDEDVDSDDERVMNQDIRDRIVQETTKRIGGNGASRADLLDAVSSALGVSEDRVDREIGEVCREGRIHEPMGDRFKPVK